MIAVYSHLVRSKPNTPSGCEARPFVNLSPMGAAHLFQFPQISSLAGRGGILGCDVVPLIFAYTARGCGWGASQCVRAALAPLWRLLFSGGQVQPRKYVSEFFKSFYLNSFVQHVSSSFVGMKRSEGLISNVGKVSSKFGKIKTGQKINE